MSARLHSKLEKKLDILENSGEEYIVIIIIKQKNNSGGPDQPWSEEDTCPSKEIGYTLLIKWQAKGLVVWQRRWQIDI